MFTGGNNENRVVFWGDKGRECIYTNLKEEQFAN